MKFFTVAFATMITMTFGFSAHAQEASEMASKKVPVSTGKYITGGILGSVIGFGIGHGVQGRYAEKGWMFTATEAAATVVLASGLTSCKKNEDTDETECSNGGLITLGYMAALGFHIWEVVDVWTGATPVDDAPKSALFLIPNPKSPGIGFAYSF